MWICMTKEYVCSICMGVHQCEFQSITYFELIELKEIRIHDCWCADGTQETSLL